MAVIGWVTVVLAGVVIIGGIAFAATAVPDYNRYRRLRKM